VNGSPQSVLVIDQQDGPTKQAMTPEGLTSNTPDTKTISIVIPNDDVDIINLDIANVTKATVTLYPSDGSSPITVCYLDKAIYYYYIVILYMYISMVVVDSMKLQREMVLLL
jgi:hypothetical protein